jgi:diguanylate cyclase (GGDEF)-like protein/putative nucleotidyltransferase with HDIG domain
VIPHPAETPTTYGIGQAAVERRKRDAMIDAQAPAIARAFALLGAGGAIVGLLGVLLPHPPAFNEGLLIATQASSLVFAVFLFTAAHRVPLWVVSVMPAIAVVLTSIAVIATDDPTSGYAFFYIWIAIICFYFLSRRETIFQIAWAIANYAVVFALTSPPTGAPVPGEQAYFFVLVAGTLLAAGAPLLYLRGRFDDLVRRLTAASRTDPLTGLANEHVLDEALAREIARAHMSGCSVAVMVIELDRMKEVVKEVGHATAGELLRRIGAMFSEAIRPTDTIARAGAAFTVIVPDVSEDEVYLMAEQLLGRVRRGFRDEVVPLTASIGIAAYPRDAASASDLLGVADRALTAAKLLGNDRAVLYSSGVEQVLGGALEARPSRDPHAHLATLLSLAEVLDLRDSGTAQHSQRVGAYAQVIARELGLSQQRIDRVRLAGILHDIGKVGIPDDVLRKAGPLDEGEWEEMRKHPEVAARILANRELVDIREWVLASHERPDGRGYPRGLSADEIPLEARILAVADAYEAMTGDRSYRAAIGPEAARRELQAHAGTQFDAEVVEGFLRALERDGDPIEALGIATDETASPNN